jgi:hypothetical protein
MSGSISQPANLFRNYGRSALRVHAASLTAACCGHPPPSDRGSSNTWMPGAGKARQLNASHDGRNADARDNDANRGNAPQQE